jgi:hypothetical protein
MNSWDIAPPGQYANRRFGGTYHLHLHGRKISPARNQSFYPTETILRLHYKEHSVGYINVKRTLTLSPLPESASELHKPSDSRFSAKLVPTLADRGCHVVSVTDLYGRILGFLDRELKPYRKKICCSFREAHEAQKYKVFVGGVQICPYVNADSICSNHCAAESIISDESTNMFALLLASVFVWCSTSVQLQDARVNTSTEGALPNCMRAQNDSAQGLGRDDTAELRHTH